MVKIVGIELTVELEIKEGMADYDVEDLAVDMVLNENNSNFININGVELIETLDS